MRYYFFYYQNCNYYAAARHLVELTTKFGLNYVKCHVWQFPEQVKEILKPYDGGVAFPNFIAVGVATSVIYADWIAVNMPCLRLQVLTFDCPPLLKWIEDSLTKGEHPQLKGRAASIVHERATDRNRSAISVSEDNDERECAVRFFDTLKFIREQYQSYTRATIMDFQDSMCRLFLNQCDQLKAKSDRVRRGTGFPFLTVRTIRWSYYWKLKDMVDNGEAPRFSLEPIRDGLSYMDKRNPVVP